MTVNEWYELKKVAKANPEKYNITVEDGGYTTDIFDKETKTHYTYTWTYDGGTVKIYSFNL